MNNEVHMNSQSSERGSKFFEKRRRISFHASSPTSYGVLKQTVNTPFGYYSIYRCLLHFLQLY